MGMAPKVSAAAVAEGEARVGVRMVVIMKR